MSMSDKTDDDEELVPLYNVPLGEGDKLVEDRSEEGLWDKNQSNFYTSHQDDAALRAWFNSKGLKYGDWYSAFTDSRILKGVKLWLMKCEPDVWGFEDLAKVKWDNWDGVRNHQAKNFMKDMEIGDLVVFYHSNATPSGAYGVMQVVRQAYWDYTAFDSSEKYYDRRSKRDKPTWVNVDVQALARFDHFVPLQSIKENPALQEMRLVKRGTRLSIIPVELNEWLELCRMGWRPESTPTSCVKNESDELEAKMDQLSEEIKVESLVMKKERAEPLADSPKGQRKRAKHN